MFRTEPVPPQRSETDDASEHAAEEKKSSSVRFRKGERKILQDTAQTNDEDNLIRTWNRGGSIRTIEGLDCPSGISLDIS